MSQGGAYYIIKRVRDWDFFNGERSELIVVKVAKPHPNITRGYRAPVFKKYSHVSLGELVDLGCVDEKLASLVNVYIREEEFKELVEQYIRKCHKDESEVNKRLQKLEELLNSPFMRYPYYVHPEFNIEIAWRAFRKAKKAYRFSIELETSYDVCVYERDFSIVRRWRGETVVYLPLSAEEVNLEAVKELDSTTVELLKDAVATIGKKLESGGDETLRKIYEVISYTLVLHEMLG